MLAVLAVLLGACELPLHTYYEYDYSKCSYYNQDSCDFCKYTPDWVESVDSWSRAVRNVPSAGEGSVIHEMAADVPTWGEVHEVVWHYLKQNFICGY